MTTGTWGENASKGIFKAVIAAFFAAALVLAMAVPANASEHLPEGEDGTLGPIADADTDDDWVEINEELWFYFDDGDDEFYLLIHPGLFDELPEDEEEFEEFFDDPFALTYDEWECVIVQLNEENNITGVNYDPDEGSQFGIIATDEDLLDCLEEEEPPPSEPAEHGEDDDPQPVERAERVETGAGGAAGGGAGVLALLFGLIAAAGATVLRKGSATS